MSFSLSAFQNLDLLSVGIAVAGMSILGFVVLFNDLKSSSSRVFFLLSMCASAWGIVNYAFYQPQVSAEYSLWLLRLVMFFGVCSAFFSFTLSYVFPKKRAVFSRRFKWILVPLTIVTAILTLTPYVFSGIQSNSVEVGVAPVMNLFGVLAFGCMTMFLNIGAIVLLVRKIGTASREERTPLGIVLFGMTVMLLLIMAFNFLLPTLVDNTRFIPLGALFLFPFITFTAYAILKFGFFSVKVAGTALLVFALSVVTFAEIIFSNTFPLVLFRTSVFVLVLTSGISLIRGVLREVEQREKIQKLAEELEATNERQEGLIHFIGHEVKGFLAKDEGAFAALVDGDFGTLEDGMKPFVEHALAESRHGAQSVTDLLTASNQKKGTVSYVKEPFDLQALAAAAVEKEQQMAKGKGLTLTFSADEAGAPYTLQGDKDKIGDHVLRNLIENSINYTPSGSVAVSLSRADGKYIFTVKDTGVGITDEDKKRLFTEGGHGKDSQKVNVHSTGYGLYIAKNIVDAHGGTIRAESEGEGKGSTFIVELPV